MSQPERFEILILVVEQIAVAGLGSGAKSGHHEAGLYRQPILQFNCMPGQNRDWSAKVAHLARDSAEFGTVAGPVKVIWPKFASASATWSTIRLPRICKTTSRAALN